jgi:hypothetical protein
MMAETNLATHGLHILAVTLTDRDRFRAIALFLGASCKISLFSLECIQIHPTSRRGKIIISATTKAVNGCRKR